MGKTVNSFNAYTDLDGNGSKTVAPKAVVASIAIAKAWTSKDAKSEQYVATVVFTEGTGSETQDVIFELKPKGTPKGMMYVDQKGTVDLSAAESGDTFTLTARSKFNLGAQMGEAKVFDGPGPVDGGRGGNSKNPSVLAATVLGTVDVTVA